MDVFGEYRSILGRTPSGDVFAALLALNRQHAKLEAYIWQYIQDHLSRWPVDIERQLSFEGVAKLKSRLRRMTARQLSLYNSVLFDEALHDIEDLIAVLKRMPHLVYFRAPYLSHSGRSEEQLSDFWRRCAGLEHLRVLDLRYAGLDDQMMQCMPVGRWASLTSLFLQHNPFGAEGLDHLIQSGVLRTLKVLDLRHVPIQLEGAQLLANQPDLANLDELYLYREDVTLFGLDALEGSTYLSPQLAALFGAK